MDLWLAPHDARVRALGELTYGFSRTPLGESFGECVALAADTRLVALRFSSDREKALAELQEEWTRVRLRPSPETGRLIARAFENPGQVPILAVGTPFQLTVWEFLRRSHSAVMLTYGEVARAIGRPTAARAVGRAAAANGLALLIPCHRVVSPGKLTGYRWGLERKKALLAWELSRRDPLDMPF